jgi:enoyl-CoA hydratase
MSMILREDIDDGIVIVTLNRPESLNALSPDLFVELNTSIQEISNQTDSVACVILRGAGRCFSAGNDLKAVGQGIKAKEKFFQAKTIDLLENLPQPTIASVHGHCLTGALELALACDLMVTAESANLSDTHGKWGMVPGWGMSVRLPKRVGLLKAKEMMFTGLSVDGVQAVDIGLANKCVSDDNLLSETVDLARKIVKNSWHTLFADKQLFINNSNQFHQDSLTSERNQSAKVASDMHQRVQTGFKS